MGIHTYTSHQRQMPLHGCIFNAIPLSLSLSHTEVDTWDTATKFVTYLLPC